MKSPAPMTDKEFGAMLKDAFSCIGCGGLLEARHRGRECGSCAGDRARALLGVPEFAVAGAEGRWRNVSE